MMLTMLMTLAVSASYCEPGFKVIIIIISFVQLQYCEYDIINGNASEDWQGVAGQDPVIKSHYWSADCHNGPICSVSAVRG